MKIHTYVSIKQYRFFETRSGLYISSCPSVHTFTLTSVIPPVQGFPMCPVCFAIFNTEVDIYKRKQENTLSTKKVIKKRKENKKRKLCPSSVQECYNELQYILVFLDIFLGFPWRFVPQYMISPHPIYHSFLCTAFPLFVCLP